MSADSFQMNSLTGKKILSYLRKGNWAHAGERRASCGSPRVNFLSSS